jgi:prepilin-type N-terminal cleavage/methylation domain-containing protein
MIFVIRQMLRGLSLQENKFMKNNKQNNGFTLIELLMVIAIIGILAGILIPTVGAVRKQANIAASKAQLSNYVTALGMFKGEYSYYPFSDAQVDGGANVNGLSDDFVETLSGRNAAGLAVSVGGNRRSIGFHSFSESEFFVEDDETINESRIADRFNNTNIFIVISSDGKGKIKVPKTNGDGTKDLRADITAYVLEGSDTEAAGSPDYYLYD